MDKFDKDDEVIVDADFSEIDSELFNSKDINGKPLYFTCKQVAQIVGENESTIRYWAKVFEPILKIEISNMTKKYTKTNIENLLFIKKLLKEDGLSVKQTLEYCSKKGFNSEEGLIDTGMPLAVKTFTKAVMVEMNKRFDAIQEEINKNNEIQKEAFSRIIKTMIEIEPNLKESLSQAIDQVMTDKMNDIDDSLQGIKNELTITRDDLVSNLRSIMNERREAEETKKKNKKGLFQIKYKDKDAVSFILDKIKVLDNYISNKKVDNIIGFLNTAIQKDWKINSTNKIPKKLDFNNFEGRNYTKEEYDNIENKLLGWE